MNDKIFRQVQYYRLIPLKRKIAEKLPHLVRVVENYTDGFDDPENSMYIPPYSFWWNDGYCSNERIQERDWAWIVSQLPNQRSWQEIAFSVFPKLDKIKI